MQDGSDSGSDIYEYLFQHLIAMYQTLALQQLGKLVNPITGKLERDLQQARITIDMLQMLQEKTAGNLTSIEKALLDRVVLELQMNFVDEMEVERRKPEEEKEPKETETVGEGEGKQKKGEPVSGADEVKKGPGTAAPEPEMGGEKPSEGGEEKPTSKRKPKRARAKRKAKGKKSKE